MASYFSYDILISTCSSKNNGKDQEFEYAFLIICRYLNLIKNLLANGKKLLQQIVNRLWEKIYVIFIEFSMKEDNFAPLKGK